MTLRNAFDAIATETTLDAVLAKLPQPTVNMPFADTPAIPVRNAPQKYTDISFPQVGSGLLTPKMTLIKLGAGQTVNQSGGNLVITDGTTVNAETVIRSVDSFNGALTLKAVVTLSQRNPNNNHYVELVDVIGDNLNFTCVSAVLVDVEKIAHGFTTGNVGQRIDIIPLTGAAGIPMEGIIQSIPNVDTIRFTVAGWPVTGTGTLSLTGWNKIEQNHTTSAATVASFNTRRNGWQNAGIPVTVPTTVSASMTSINAEGGIVSFASKAVSGSNVLANMASWDTNVPEPGVELLLQIRSKNGTVAPTATTWTVGMLRVEDYIATQVALSSVRQMSVGNTLPVSQVGTSAVTISGTPNVGAAAGVPGTPYHVNSLATTNGALILTGTSGLHAFWATNTGAAAAFVKLYNKATAPTVGTDVPAMIIPVPAAVAGVPGVAPLPIGFHGFRFPLGLGIAITGGVADTDTTTVAAGQVKVSLSRTA